MIRFKVSLFSSTIFTQAKFYLEVNNIIKKILLVTGIALGIFIFGFIIWAENSLGPMQEVDEIIQNSDVSVVYENGYYKIGENDSVGLIYYPGGKVDPRSYIPLAINISKHNITTFIPRMPLNLAIFSPNKALEIIKKFPEIKNWFIAGHSLGGAMASRVVYKNPNTFKGLILNASYPPKNNSLKDRDIKVLSIYGTRDGHVKEIELNRKYLPPNTEFFIIQGGNHAQFGYYGKQKGDLDAEISREEQQRITAEKMVEFIKNIE